MLAMTKALDIGCGHSPKNFFNADEVFGIDVRDDVEARIYRADLVIEPIPFLDETFDFVTAHDFLEHIPRVIYVPHRRNAFVEVMNEVWRVLKPGGQFLSFTPAFPHGPAWTFYPACAETIRLCQRKHWLFHHYTRRG